MQSDIPAIDRTGLIRSRLATDRPEEMIELLQLPSLPEAKFWRVEESDRHWGMLHDAFTACLVRGPQALSARWRSRGEERSIGPGHVQLMEPGEVHTTTEVS